MLIVVCAAAFAASKLNPELNTGNDDTDGSAVFTLDADSVTALSFKYTGSLSFEHDNGTWYPMTILTFRLTARALTAW